MGMDRYWHCTSLGVDMVQDRGTIANQKKEDLLEDDPLWYRDAIIYELHVRAFHDSDGDGVGDFRGLIKKLDYLKDLGVTAIWLLPFYPSPLKDDGYDIADYTNIHPDYGNIRDFKAFLREAHRRGLRVITEFVLNHTSDQHPWFQRARRAMPGSKWRNFYVWSDTPNRYKEARIIFKDFEHSNWEWDGVANAYYWHRFYSHQPDLNYDNPDLQKAIFKLIDFWLEMGVDGLRLDAVPYLYEREGTNCENLPETYAFLKRLRAHVDGKYRNRMLLAEANQWPEDAAAYLGEGDLCHIAFHFPLMPRLFMAVRMEDRFPVIDILEQTPAIPESCQWALFLRNHDELTLEMVTDEERDYMYRVYAYDSQMRINLGIRRRLSTLLGNHRNKIELMKSLLFSLPGTPVIYYGDEIGMGDNVYLGDRDGVRTPMQWSADRNAGFSRANPQRLYLPVIIDPEYCYDAINVEAQQNNSNSLLWWMKHLISLRKQFKAFGRGTLVFLYPDNHKVLSFIRSFEDECILVVANLSRFAQYVELDLSAYAGTVPVELFGRTEFPPIGEQPYFLTLGPYAFFWFALETKRAIEEPIETKLPVITVAGRWDAIFKGKAKSMLEEILPDYLKTRRWFGGKAKRIRSVKIKETIPVSHAYITMVQVEYVEGDSETYTLPLTYTTGERPNGAFVRVQLKDGGEEGVIYDAAMDESFCEVLLNAISRRRRFKGTAGEIAALPTQAFRQIWRDEPMEISTPNVEQSNTSVIYGERFILKIFRRIEAGINPDLEIGRFLTEKGFAHIPQVAGAIEYRRGRDEPTTLAILQGFVPNEGGAWQYTTDILSRYFEHALALTPEVRAAPPHTVPLLDLVENDFPQVISEMIDTYMEAARLLGERTAEMHIALASAPDEPDFAPEPFSMLYQRSLYQSMRSLARQVFQLLRRRLNDLPETLQEEAKGILEREGEVIERFRSITEQRIAAMRIRCHGDYRLPQVLFTGKDFVIIDFEGEPARPLSERRIKRSPLRDVAGMIRSFHYAAYSDLLMRVSVRPEDTALLEPWADMWHQYVSGVFLRSYLNTAGRAPFLPDEREELEILLHAFILEKAVYELGYELNNRPNWAIIPIRGIKDILKNPHEKSRF